MKNWTMITYICLSYCFISLGANATTAEVDAKVMKSQLFVLVGDYASSLKMALQQGKMDGLEAVVEMDSPWYKFLNECKEANEWSLPMFAGANAPYYSYPWLTLVHIAKALSMQQEEVEVVQESGEKYTFSVGNVQVTVSYTDGTMKLYSFKVAGLNKIHDAQLM